jgi:curved DNA-binding protein CbpA
MPKNLSDKSKLEDILNNIQKGIAENKKKKSYKHNISDDSFELKNNDINSDNSETYKYKETHRTRPSINAEKKSQTGSSDNNQNNDIVFDYYKILRVSPSDTQEKINKKANERLAQYHPDKTKMKILQYPPDERKKQSIRYESQYVLVRKARDILINPEKRKYYDLQRKTNSTNFFMNKKESYDEFIKLQESEATEDKKMMAISSYKHKSDELDKKHGFNSSEKYGKDRYKFEKKDFHKRVEDLEVERTQMETTYMPDYMGNINNKDFNKNFEIYKKKKEKKTKKSNDDRTITKWENIAAANDYGDGGGNYMGIGDNDNDYENMYKEDKNKEYLFSSKLGSDDEESLSSLDDEILKEIDVSYTKNYNKDREKTMQNYEEKLKQREIDESIFDSRTIENGSWKGVMDNPFNISYQTGKIIGDDIDIKDDKKITKEMKDAYKALMYNREK